MKPKKTVEEKREVAKRKNRIHWLSHKHQISMKRSIQKSQLESLTASRSENVEVETFLHNDSSDTLSFDKSLSINGKSFSPLHESFDFSGIL